MAVPVDFFVSRMIKEVFIDTLMEYLASVCKFMGLSRILLCWLTPKFDILLKLRFQMSMVTVDRVLIVDT